MSFHVRDIFVGLSAVGRQKMYIQTFLCAIGMSYHQYIMPLFPYSRVFSNHFIAVIHDRQS